MLCICKNGRLSPAIYQNFKKIRKREKELSESGYESTKLNKRILQNLDFARANMKANIYDQTVNHRNS